MVYPIEFMSCVSGLINALGLTPMSSSKGKFQKSARVGRAAFTTKRFTLDSTIFKPAVVVLTSGVIASFLQQVKFFCFFKFQRV